eukprot:413502-Amphidinium_carterae.1
MKCSNVAYMELVCPVCPGALAGNPELLHAWSSKKDMADTMKKAAIVCRNAIKHTISPPPPRQPKANTGVTHPEVGCYGAFRDFVEHARRIQNKATN